MRFLHCSDVHVTADYFSLPKRRLGWRRLVSMVEIMGGRGKLFARASELLTTMAGDARRLGVEHFILSGDLTAYALEPEFAQAREALGSLAHDPRRCTIVPGNHDVFTPGSLRKGRFEQYFGQLLGSDLPEHRREGPYPFVRLVGTQAAVVGLSSARVPPMPGIAFGFVGRAQLEGLEAIVKDPRLVGRAVLVVVHHAPLTSQGKEDHYLHGLRDAHALLELLPGPRFAVLHGHIHQRFHHVATQTRPHVFSAGSSTQAGREGYWIIEAEGGLIVGGQPHAPGEDHASVLVQAPLGGLEVRDAT